MIVMGGIVGSGIFINPYVVAQRLHTPFLIVGAWALGGLLALCGAFIWAELAFRAPQIGGQYAYLREAYHPGLAFLYGWTLLLVTQSGGMAACAVTFARYFLEITHLPLTDWLVAAATLAALTIINCLGVKAGSNVQSALMVIKMMAVAGLVVFGFWRAGTAPAASSALLDRPVSFDLLTAVGAAMVPVLFAFGGWQTSSFIAGEMKNPQRDLPRGLLLGVCGVIAMYLAVSWVCVRVLGADGLAHTSTPASAVMRLALGNTGGLVTAMAVAISTLGFLSQSMLTAPRVYFAMAEDGLFFRGVAWISPRTAVPVVAIALQGLMATVVAISGRFEQILNYVTSMDWVWFGLTGASLFVFRRQAIAQGLPEPTTRMPGHPYTTALFVTACWLVVVNTLYKYPANSLIGFGILLSGIPVYFLWRGRRK